MPCTVPARITGCGHASGPRFGQGVANSNCRGCGDADDVASHRFSASSVGAKQTELAMLITFLSAQWSLIPALNVPECKADKSLRDRVFGLILACKP